MDLSSGGIAKMVFKSVVRGEFGKLYLDGQMLSVLTIMDGKKTLGQIARETGISLSDMRQVIMKLLRCNLVERIERTVSIVDQEFINFLVFRMSLAVGPLGEIIVEDTLEELGFNRNNFPCLRTGELVNRLSREIKRENKCLEFKQIISREIREKRMLD
jgi:hypothetical protein